MIRAILLLACIVCGPPAAEAQVRAGPPERDANGDIDDTYVKPPDQGVWGAVLSGFGLGSFQKSHAVVIGISRFDDYGDLPTEADPLRMRDFLIEDQGFDTVITLTGHAATKERITALMVDDVPGLVGPNDRFLFYWSGHGVTREIGTRKFGYLPVATSRKGAFASMVRMADIEDWNRYLGAKQVLYLLDSCFSGLAGIVKQSQDLAALNERQMMGPSRHLITAGTGDQVTIASASKWGGSIFTDALIDGLKNGLADSENGQYGKDGLISVQELITFLSSRVGDAAQLADYGEPLTPQLSDMASNAGSFFFTVPEGKYGLRRAPPEPGPGTFVTQGEGQAGASTYSEADIRRIQEHLKALGYLSDAPTGVLDFATEVALAAFQGEVSLDITGRMDEPTRRALLARIVAAKGSPGAPNTVPLDNDAGGSIGAAAANLRSGEALEAAGDLDAAVRAYVAASDMAGKALAVNPADPVANRILDDAREAFVRVTAPKADTGTLPVRPGQALLAGTDPDGPVTFRDCDLCPTMMEIGGGTVTLGRDNGPEEEGPAHQVRLRPFAMAVTEITNGQWNAFLDATGGATLPDPNEGCYVWDRSPSPPRMRKQPPAVDLPFLRGDDALPRACVSHRDALAYVEWLNEVTGGGYRLPIDAEFEFVLRAQTLPSDPAQACAILNGADMGSPFLHANTSCDDGAPGAAPVGTYEADPRGLHDVYGNLWEILHNCWTERLNATETRAQDYPACQSGTVPVRGASFDDPAGNFRPTIRQPVPNIRRQENIGFRVVKYPI